MSRYQPLASDDPRHGTLSGYTNHACSCEPCRTAMAVYRAGRRARQANTLPADDLRHGTLNGYTNYRCRCDRCRAVGTVARQVSRLR